jgi:hypothetical protein
MYTTESQAIERAMELSEVDGKDRYVNVVKEYGITCILVEPFKGSKCLGYATNGTWLASDKRP